MSNFFDPFHGLSDLLHNLEQMVGIPDSPDLHSTPHPHSDHASGTSDPLADLSSGLSNVDETTIATHPHHLSFLETHQRSMAFHSAHSSASDTPYITVSSSGSVYLHKINGDTVCVGDYRNGAFWNQSGNRIGYLNDGVVYDYFDKRQGAFHGGCIFNRKGVEIGHADTGVEAAAYILYVERGGVQ